MWLDIQIVSMWLDIQSLAAKMCIFWYSAFLGCSYKPCFPLQGNEAVVCCAEIILPFCREAQSRPSILKAVGCQGMLCSRWQHAPSIFTVLKEKDD